MSIPSFTTPSQEPSAAPSTSPLLQPRFPRYPETYTFEPSTRRVRGIVGDVAVVDSREQILVWEPGHKVPEYGFPRAHVRTGLLRESDGLPEPGTRYRPQTPNVRWFDLVMPDRVIRHAAWQWTVAGLEDHFAVTWTRGVLDAWYEEDELVMTHPRDPFIRVDALPSSRHVTVSIGGVVVADTTAAVAVYETGLPTRWYIPREDVRFDTLTPVETWSECPYKGYATDYWSTADGHIAHVAWSYPDPQPNVAAITGLVAFFDDDVELRVQ